MNIVQYPFIFFQQIFFLHTIINNKKENNKSNIQSSLGNFPCGIEGRSVPFELK